MTDMLKRILPTVQKPARYTGGEYNEIKKDLADVRVRVAFCFPDTYEIGMSNLGMQILYSVMNNMDGVWCERVFAPWDDMEQKMLEKGLPLWALESQDPIKDFDMVAFTIGYEMAYTNILNMLKLAKIPLRSSERTGLKGIVFAGGVCAYNPEPIADFIDFFALGEGEEITPQIIALYDRAKEEDWSKERFLEEVSKIPGIYVPAFYTQTYNEDGTISAVNVKNGAPKTITKRIVENLDTAFYPQKMVVPSTEIVHDRANLEVFRGCVRGCRFCQAGFSCRPVRKKHADVLFRQAKDILTSSGHNEITLCSLSTSDYRELKELTDEMIPYCGDHKISLSVPSLRADNFSRELMQKVQTLRKSGLTFAPEAGSQKMRDVINKGVTEEDLMNAVAAAFKSGWNSVKLYFMIGLPFETDEDILAIADLAKKVQYKYYEITGKRGCKVTVSASGFVPKPYTAFQWFAQNDIETLRRKQFLLKDALKVKNITFQYHDAKTSIVEAIFARGDRRLGKVLLTAWQKGARFDGWSDCFSYDRWLESMAECGLDKDFYAARTRGENEVFPWEHVQPAVSRKFLWREWEKAEAQELTHDCRRSTCTGCGVCQKLGVEIVDYKRGEA